MADVDREVVGLGLTLSRVDSRAAAHLDATWGRACRGELSQPQLALRAFERACEGARKLGDERALAEYQALRGLALARLSHPVEALDALGKADSCYRGLADERGRAMIALNRAHILASVSRHDEALEAYAIAAGYYAGSGADESLGRIAEGRANVLRSLSRFPEALDAIRLAETHYRNAGSRRGLAGLAWNRALLFSELGRLSEALAAIDSAREFYEAAGDGHQLAAMSPAQASVLGKLSRFAEALAVCGAAEDYFKRVGDSGGLARISVARADVLLATSRFAEALTAYRLAESWYRSVGDGHAAMLLALRRGMIFRSLGRLDEALAEYRAAEDHFRRLGDVGQLAWIAQARGNVYFFRSSFSEALEAYRAADSLYEKLGNHAARGHVAGNIANTLRSLSSHQEAMDAFAAAERYFRSSGDRAAQASLANARGGLFFAMSRYSDALAAFKEAEAYYVGIGDTFQGARLSACRGAALHQMGRRDDALSAYVDWLDRTDATLGSEIPQLGETTSEHLRSTFAEIPARALNLVLTDRECARQDVEFAYRIIQTNFARGVAEGLAERAAFDRIDLPETVRSRLLKIEAERCQAIARRDRLAQGSGSPSAEHHEQELAAAVARIQELTALESGVLDSVRLSNAMAFAIDYPKASTLAEVEAEVPPTAALLEYVFDEQHGCYAFVIRRGGSRILDLGAPGEVAMDLKALVGEMKARGRGAPTDRAERLRRLGKRLLDPVLRTFGKDDHPKTLLIALHGELCRLPFEMLLTKDPSRDAPVATWPFLVKTFDVAYVHSGTVLHAMRQESKQPRQRKKGSPEFVAFGFPYDAEVEAKDTGREDLPGDEIGLLERRDRGILFWSGDEVLDVARIFASDADDEAALDTAKAAFQREALTTRVERVSGRRFSLFMRGGANERSLKTEEVVAHARIVHLACHGEADLTSPQLSRLVLARSKKIENVTGEDGYVYVRDLKRLRLVCDLLVLSACGSNDGVRSPVEGITGLSRAGLVAGARSVLSTLWPVEDAAARALMVGFYRRWIEGGRTRIHALSEAKRIAIAEGIPLETWAAYTLCDAEVQ